MEQPEHNWLMAGLLAIAGVVGSCLAWLLKLAWSDRVRFEARVDDCERCILDHDGRIKTLEATHKRWDDGHVLDREIQDVKARVASHGHRIDNIERKMEREIKP